MLRFPIIMETTKRVYLSEIKQLLAVEETEKLRSRSC